MSADRWADLHVHSHWSDGTLPLPELAHRARQARLSAIAVTDHDTIGPDLVAPAFELHGVEIITGVEIKAWVDGHKGEILGYFLHPGHPALEELFRWMKVARQERMKAMVQKCQEVLGRAIVWEEVQALAAGSVGRPHLAALLVRHGLAVDHEDAFQRFLQEGAPCYVPLPRPTSAQAIAAIRAAGGVAALAHPAFMTFPDWEDTLSRLAAEGLRAVEIDYPYATSRQPIRTDPQLLAALAEQLGLIPTGGSDDHGPGSVKDAMGTVRVPYEVVERLRSSAS